MESKDAVEDHALMRRESVRRLEPVEREGRAATEQSEQFGILLLLDAHVSTDREIDERGGDIAHVGAVVEQSARFGR